MSHDTSCANRHVITDRHISNDTHIRSNIHIISNRRTFFAVGSN